VPGLAVTLMLLRVSRAAYSSLNVDAVCSSETSVDFEQFRGNILQNVRLEVFTAVTMKNVVFWDIKAQFVLHRRHITSLLQSPAS
jgi:hypothetical protein